MLLYFNCHNITDLWGCHVFFKTGNIACDFLKKVFDEWITEWIMFRAFQLHKEISLLTTLKTYGCSLTFGLFGLAKALSQWWPVGVMVEKEACEGGVVDIICIEPIILSIPVHLEPDLVAYLQVEKHRARGLVQVLVLVLVIGEEHGLVLLVEADLHILQVDCDMVGKIVQPRNVAVEFSSGAIIVVLLIIEDFGEANGNTGDSDPGLQSHTECWAVYIGAFSRFSFPAWDSWKSSGTFNPSHSSFTTVTLRTSKT